MFGFGIQELLVILAIVLLIFCLLCTSDAADE